MALATVNSQSSVVYTVLRPADLLRVNDLDAPSDFSHQIGLTIQFPAGARGEYLVFSPYSACLLLKSNKTWRAPGSVTFAWKDRRSHAEWQADDRPVQAGGPPFCKYTTYRPPPWLQHKFHQALRTVALGQFNTFIIRAVFSAEPSPSCDRPTARGIGASLVSLPMELVSETVADLHLADVLNLAKALRGEGSGRGRGAYIVAAQEVHRRLRKAFAFLRVDFSAWWDLFVRAGALIGGEALLSVIDSSLAKPDPEEGVLFVVLPQSALPLDPEWNALLTTAGFRATFRAGNVSHLQIEYTREISTERAATLAEKPRRIWRRDHNCDPAERIVFVYASRIWPLADFYLNYCVYSTCTAVWIDQQNFVVPFPHHTFSGHSRGFARVGAGHKIHNFCKGLNGVRLDVRLHREYGTRPDEDVGEASFFTPSFRFPLDPPSFRPSIVARKA